jgi:tetratricopeptide (TPR) repeat protein
MSRTDKEDYTKEIVEALEQDWKTGLSLFEEVLRNPGDLDGRKKLRELERKHRERKKSILRLPFSHAHADSVLDCELHLLHNPWDVECLFKLGELLRSEKAVAEWIYEDIEQLVREKADAKTWERLAEGYEGADAWKKALGIYRRLNADSPRPHYEAKIAEAEMQMASSSGSNRSYRDLIKDEEEAKKLEESGRLPKSAEDYLRKARVKEEELQAAATPQQKARILAEIAKDYLRAGDAPRARENYEEVLKLDPNNSHAAEELLRIDMAAAQERGKAVEIGIAGYEKLLGIEPTNPEYNLELGKLLLEAEDYGKAILAFQKAGRHPNFKRRARVGLAGSFSRQGLHALAGKEYEEMLSDSGLEETERMEATYALAECLYHMGESARAFELFGEVYRKRADFKDVKERVFELNEKLHPSVSPGGDG